jgi:hypothetical protein
MKTPFAAEKLGRNAVHWHYKILSSKSVLPFFRRWISASLSVLTRRLTHLAKEKARAEGTLDESQIKKIRRLKNVLTTGNPPLYSFKPFDLIHAHNERISVQICTATDDRCGSSKIDGEITFRLYEGTAQRAIYTCTQSEFVELLKSGCCRRLNIDVRCLPS